MSDLMTGLLTTLAGCLIGFLAHDKIKRKLAALRGQTRVVQHRPAHRQTRVGSGPTVHDRSEEGR